MLTVLLSVAGSDCSGRAVDDLIEKMHAAEGSFKGHLLTMYLSIPYARAAGMIGGEKVKQYYEEEGIESLKPARARLEPRKYSTPAISSLVIQLKLSCGSRRRTASTSLSLAHMAVAKSANCCSAR